MFRSWEELFKFFNHGFDLLSTSEENENSSLWKLFMNLFRLFYGRYDIVLWRHFCPMNGHRELATRHVNEGRLLLEERAILQEIRDSEGGTHHDQFEGVVPFRSQQDGTRQKAQQ